MDDRQDVLRAVIIDDEPLARERIGNLLEADERVRVVAACGNAEDALRAMDEAAPDIIFLDIQMPGIDGFEMLESLEEPRPFVIFVTAHEEHALRAFEEEALDFLVKPFSRRRFQSALDRVVRSLRSRHSQHLLEQIASYYKEGAADRSDAEESPTQLEDGREATDVGRPLRKIVVRSGSKKTLVDVDDIEWIEAADYYARLHTGDGSPLVRLSLTWFENHLDPLRFVRIHRSYIVNVDRVREIAPWSAGTQTVVLEDGTRLRMSVSRRPDLERLLGQSL